MERDPEGVPVDDQSGLGEWVRTYLRFGWPEDGKLKVRGYLGVFYRTQTWTKAK